jgi:hypothetical protein
MSEVSLMRVLEMLKDLDLLSTNLVTGINFVEYFPIIRRRIAR